MKDYVSFTAHVAKSTANSNLFRIPGNCSFSDTRRKPLAGFRLLVDNESVELVQVRSSWISTSQITHSTSKIEDRDSHPPSLAAKEKKSLAAGTFKSFICIILIVLPTDIKNYELDRWELWTGALWAINRTVGQYEPDRWIIWTFPSGIGTNTSGRWIIPSGIRKKGGKTRAGELTFFSKSGIVTLWKIKKSVILALLFFCYWFSPGFFSIVPGNRKRTWCGKPWTKSGTMRKVEI